MLFLILISAPIHSTILHVQSLATKRKEKEKEILTSLFCEVMTGVLSMSLTHGLLCSLTFPYLYSSLLNASLVGHVLYSADLMSAMNFYLMVHRYI